MPELDKLHGCAEGQLGLKAAKRARAEKAPVAGERGDSSEGKAATGWSSSRGTEAERRGGRSAAAAGRKACGARRESSAKKGERCGTHTAMWRDAEDGR